jgi:hypothetical protein
MSYTISLEEINKLVALLKRNLPIEHVDVFNQVMAIIRELKPILPETKAPDTIKE